MVGISSAVGVIGVSTRGVRAEYRTGIKNTKKNQGNLNLKILYEWKKNTAKGSLGQNLHS